MRKKALNAKVDALFSETRAALQAVYDALNHGQQSKLLKNEAVAALLQRYGVELEAPKHEV